MAAAALACVLATACSKNERSGNLGGGAPERSAQGREGGSAGAVRPRLLWDITGIIGSGQSLSVGAQATAVASTKQPYSNLKLSLGAAAVPPYDPESPELSLVPLVEPIRELATSYPSAYPRNIYGETPHTAMGTQISSMVRALAGADYVTVHSVVGENGQGMRMLDKAAVEAAAGDTSTGRAYAASLFEVEAIQRLAKARNQTYGVGAIILTHGETDTGSPTYEADLVQLWTDYNADVRAITGQAESIPLLVTQHHSFGFTAGAVSGAAPSTLAQWRVGVSQPREILCVGPKYQYPYAADTVHLEALGYQLLGEKYGQVYFERVVLGRSWQPLQPTAVAVSGRDITVTFHVPVPPLAWDEALPAPHQTALTEWRAGRGFELRSGAARLAIESVSIDGDAIRVRSAVDLPAGSTLGYAVTSDGTVPPNTSRRWGQLRDSDPFVGAATGRAQPNYSVAFEWPLP